MSRSRLRRCGHLTVRFKAASCCIRNRNLVAVGLRGCSIVPVPDAQNGSACESAKNQKR
jgi:hypothetical protein